MLARPILCLLEAASCPKGREELITNSFEIFSFELWLASNGADTRFIVTDTHRLLTDKILANSCNLVPRLPGCPTFSQDANMTAALAFLSLPTTNARLKESLKGSRDKLQRKLAKCGSLWIRKCNYGNRTSRVELPPTFLSLSFLLYNGSNNCICFRVDSTEGLLYKSMMFIKHRLWIRFYEDYIPYRTQNSHMASWNLKSRSDDYLYNSMEQIMFKILKIRVNTKY